MLKGITCIMRKYQGSTEISIETTELTHLVSCSPDLYSTMWTLDSYDSVEHIPHHSTK